MGEADRIAREQLESDRRRGKEEEDRAAALVAANAAAEVQAIGSLSREVLALLKARRFEDFKPEPLTIEVERFSPLGSLFGYRKIVKGGWKIAEWRWDRERRPHTVWLLDDGRYCWSGAIVSISEFSNWHESHPVSEGRAAMIEGLEQLRGDLEGSRHRR